VDALEFENLVNACYAPLYRFAMSLARTEPVAADLTQQTFFLWATRGHQLRDRTKAKPWLFTTLYREFLAHHRTESRFASHDDEGDHTEMPAQCTSVADTLDGSMVLSALQQITEVYRVPLTLFYLQDLSYREIASVLQVPPGTVMSRLARGKVALRKIVCRGFDATRADKQRQIPTVKGRQVE
jgi:RNA polymerase sigma-70 factor (ECF subfamily)